MVEVDECTGQVYMRREAEEELEPGGAARYLSHNETRRHCRSVSQPCQPLESIGCETSVRASTRPDRDPRLIILARWKIPPHGTLE